MCTDGSDAAIGAAKWAIPEALNRDVPLRIIHVIPEESDADDRPGQSDRFSLEIQYAESSLRQAVAAVDSANNAVKVETEILWGPVESVLIEESGHSSMLCLGSVGIGPIARAILGSTAATVAPNAHCPVAIIRKHDESPRTGPQWIAVGVEDRADNEPVIEAALKEARLRHSPILAVGIRQRDFGDIAYDEMDRRVAEWKQLYPDVHIRPVASPGGIAGFLAEYGHNSIQLAVVGRVDANTIAQIIGPHGHAVIRHSDCSLLVVH
ncbi:universal stress protein [Mycolicibacterium nivoides]|uniref:universal stress protein n=1 Tax=Mycolicibacterium nivoides TaxID=2487344 RepID=UPI0039A77039